MNFIGGKNRIFTSTTFQDTEDKMQEGEWILTAEDKELIIKWNLLCCYAGKVCNGRKRAEILHRADGGGLCNEDIAPTSYRKLCYAVSPFGNHLPKRHRLLGALLLMGPMTWDGCVKSVKQRKL